MLEIFVYFKFQRNISISYIMIIWLLVRAGLFVKTNEKLNSIDFMETKCSVWELKFIKRFMPLL